LDHIVGVPFEQFGLQAGAECWVGRFGAKRFGEQCGKAQQRIRSLGGQRTVPIEEPVHLVGELV
jgi:hypothetical protein